MEITMYELLGMIKDGKIPKKIKYDNKLYTFDDKKDNYYKDETTSINWDYVSLHCLNEKVEILKEEKKIPEKLEYYDFDESLDANTKCECLRERMQEIENQLDEIIDFLKQN